MYRPSPRTRPCLQSRRFLTLDGRARLWFSRSSLRLSLSPLRATLFLSSQLGVAAPQTPFSDPTQRLLPSSAPAIQPLTHRSTEVPFDFRNRFVQISFISLRPDASQGPVPAHGRVLLGVLCPGCADAPGTKSVTLRAGPCSPRYTSGGGSVFESPLVAG